MCKVTNMLLEDIKNYCKDAYSPNLSWCKKHKLRKQLLRARKELTNTPPNHYKAEVDEALNHLKPSGLVILLSVLVPLIGWILLVYLPEIQSFAQVKNTHPTPKSSESRLYVEPNQYPIKPPHK